MARDPHAALKVASPHAALAARTARFGPRLAAHAALFALTLGLAGCGAGEGLDGAFGAQDTGVAGGQRLNVPGAPAAGVQSPDGTLIVGTGPNAQEFACPPVTVRSGASAWQVPAQGGGLRYQSRLGQLARECSIANGTMTMKVGIEGLVLSGDKGGPGTVNVPLRLAVVHEGPNPKTVATKFFVVPVTIAPGEAQAPFAVVEDALSFPLASPAAISNYVVYVGFDPKGQPAEKPKPAPSRPRTTSKPAAAPAASSTSSAPASSSRSSAPPDVFGPPPASSSGSSSSSSSGGFGPAPDVFGPPPR